MKRESKSMRLDTVLESLGFTAAEADTLRRAEMTLHRWAERECNGEIERDEETGKVFYFSNSRGERYKHAGYVPDRETGALKRIRATLEARNLRCGFYECQPAKYEHLSFYHQTDPRGCALYILRPGDVPEGEDAGSYYSRGVAVCI